MTRNDRMAGCICANGAKVAEIVHPYCPAHVPPEMEAQLASLRAELAEAAAHVRELERNALPSNCTRCNGAGAEPPGCPESGPCERCGGWTTHKRLVAGEASTLRAEVERLKARPVGVPGEVHAAVDALYRWCRKDGWSEYVEATIDVIGEWLASLPGGDS